jgi:hypothetical protein
MPTPALQVGGKKFTIGGLVGGKGSGPRYTEMGVEKEREEPSGPDEGSPELSSPAVVGFVLMCLATAMTLPAFIWLAGGGLCGGATSCSGPADIPGLALVLLWLSVPLGIAALVTLISAWTKIHRSGSKLLPVGFVLAVVGTLTVASIAFQIFSRALNESI